MKNFQILILFFFCTYSLFSQKIDSTKQDELKTLSRIKISAGYFGGEFFGLRNYGAFMNLNYHASELSRNKENFELGLFLEAGINYISGFFPLYIKVGPEFKIINNLIVSANIGLFEIYFYPIAFYGFNIFYLVEVSKKIYLEMESGFHSPFIEKKLQIFYYSIGISLN